MRTSVVCIGAGPAGLTAAYLLSKQGVGVTVLESDPQYVGGISRTATLSATMTLLKANAVLDAGGSIKDRRTTRVAADGSAACGSTHATVSS